MKLERKKYCTMAARAGHSILSLLGGAVMSIKHRIAMKRESGRQIIIISGRLSFFVFISWWMTYAAMASSEAAVRM